MEDNKQLVRNIFFLHGFASAGFGEKTETLKSVFGASRVLAMNFPTDTKATISQLKFFAPVLQKNNTLLVGSSLGGFYAAWMSYTFGLQSVLVNPALDANVLLRAYHGQEINNYKTSEKYLFGEKDTQALNDLYVPQQELLKVKNNIFFYLDKDDELLDSQKTAQTYKDFSVTVYEGGNHSFAHMKEMISDILRKEIIQ